jgi:hypothetical protein
MLGRAAAVARGVAAALQSPLWLRRNNLVELIGEPDPIDLIRATHAERAGPALRAAHATLRLLGRAAFPLWRNTCLYRAVAECLVLRRCGIPCRLELGVGHLGTRGWGLGVGNDEELGKITAHAWVVRADGAATASPPAALAVLR